MKEYLEYLESLEDLENCRLFEDFENWEDLEFWKITDCRLQIADYCKIMNAFPDETIVEFRDLFWIMNIEWFPKAEKLQTTNYTEVKNNIVQTSLNVLTIMFVLSSFTNVRFNFTV